ncbi:hypothetical protein CTI12_AA079520 [Artemisia annua]|uniref:Uncharacterized protein n=1 Tax=Artemisia annua TaxID=35608 RepID=A0A2U1NU87_ARTAN|nr:hypothetical protein CTI12_AA079520 [Artemisia annua]
MTDLDRTETPTERRRSIPSPHTAVGDSQTLPETPLVAPATGTVYIVGQPTTFVRKHRHEPPPSFATSPENIAGNNHHHVRWKPRLFLLMFDFDIYYAVGLYTSPENIANHYVHVDV